MLALVGAIVAFRGWPPSANGAEVQQVPLSRRPAVVRVGTVALTSRVVRTRSIVSLATSRARLSTAGLVKQAGPRVVSGVIRDPAPVAMHNGGRQPVVPGPPANQPVVEAPIAPPSAGPTPVGDPSGPIIGLLGGSPPPPPQSDQVLATVGQLIGPPPLVSGVAAAIGLRSRR
jgi:hypothetical protein